MNKQKFLAVILTLSFSFGWTAISMDANFIQCPGPGVCNGSPNDDVIAGTDLGESIFGFAGRDLMFGQGGADSMFGAEHDDVMFGGTESDVFFADTGNDVIIPGPDDLEFIQSVFGDLGNDSVYTFAGETINCLRIFGDEDYDVVNLIGFGPYTATLPFGQDGGFTDFAIVVQDPIALGLIIIYIINSDNDAVEQINGLLSPDLTIIPPDDINDFVAENCIDTV